MSTTKQPQWRKSSFCAGSNCVEVAELAGDVLIRDSKNPAGAPLSFSTEEWSAFVRGIKDGQFSVN